MATGSGAKFSPSRAKLPGVSAREARFPGSSHAANAAAGDRVVPVAAVPVESVEVMTATPTSIITTSAIAFASEELACLIRYPSIGMLTSRSPDTSISTPCQGAMALSKGRLRNGHGILGPGG